MDYTFSAYGIQVRHPQDWRIFINPRQPFSPAEGLVKIEKLSGQRSLASLAVSWNTVPETVTDFVPKYLDEVENTYVASLKSKSSYNFHEKTIFTVAGESVGFIHSSYQANAHIFKGVGGTRKLCLLQTVQHCPATNRALVGTMTTSAEYLAKHRPELQDMVFSLGWQRQVVELPEPMVVAGV